MAIIEESAGQLVAKWPVLFTFAGALNFTRFEHLSQCLTDDDGLHRNRRADLLFGQFTLLVFEQVA